MSVPDLMRRILMVEEHCSSTGRFPSARQWALAAGLSHGYLGALKVKLRKAGDEGNAGRSEELVALAKAAGVSVAWFVSGEGSMLGDAPPSTVIVEYDHPDPAFRDAAAGFVIMHRNDQDGGEAARKAVQSFVAQKREERWSVGIWHQELEATLRRARAAAKGKTVGEQVIEDDD